ncbi:MAG: molybdenum cofactor guanylyltransferase [Actinobacteria bacterium]|nr:molybdenum cofactor guanylyltransferase [Actinomycetota bacterium]
MADQGLTGVLLVGGASTRFGSPKALARFGGETLAERAWRILGEACDERLAVGKPGELELPFDVLADGLDVRAPIAGVIAGLRAATHDVAVFLPVDCPLVTPELLRALGEARAVPKTGPLPGAYRKDDLPVLEQRLSVGELSLRGVNPRVLELDERLLANVNTAAELRALALEQDLAARDEHPA